MSELRLDQFVMPAARLGPPSSLVPFWYDTSLLIAPRKPGPGLTDEDVRYIGYGYVNGCLPYTVQDDYDRKRTPRSFRTAVLENEQLRATFLLDYGGRLWSLHHKPSDRELLHLNPVFQPANLGIRNAWFSGGVEWNFCWIGHTPLTCAPLFAARVAADDGTPVLRMWEYERVRQMAYQIDAWLPDGSPVLLVRVRLVNRDNRTVPIYWWSNIAAPEWPDGRILAPADSFFRIQKETKEIEPYPVHDGIDYSYPINSDRSGDRFFRIPAGQYPWIADVDGRGRGLFHASTSRLNRRKLWVFGQKPGGRRWQDFLNTPGHPYVEIQGGLAQTQTECAPMPPRTEWNWLEAYGSVEADPAAVHGKDWPAAWRAVEDRINEQVTFERIERELAASAAMAERPPGEMINRGSGWGALELRRRARAGQRPFHAASVAFPDDTLDEEQADWLDLLETGRLPEKPPEQPPVSWMIQDEWREMLERSIADGAGDHYYAWLHLGIMYLGAERHEEARRAWRRSVEIRPSAWALRHLAALAEVDGDLDEAARLYPQAAALAPDCFALAIECGKSLIKVGRHRQLLELLETLSPRARANGHVRLMEAQAALAEGDLERVGRIFAAEMDLSHVREGDTAAAETWFAYQARRLARQLGVAVDEALVQRVRKECPPPSYLDYRLG